MRVFSPRDSEGVREAWYTSGHGQAGGTCHLHFIPGHHAGLRGSDPVPTPGQARGHPAQGTLMVGAPQCHQA